jgi:hypothetical protein
MGCAVIPVIAVTLPPLITRALLAATLAIVAVAISTPSVSSETKTFATPDPQKAPVSVQPEQFAWTSDLHALGLAPGKDTLHVLAEYSMYGALFFLDDSTLAATFVTRENMPGLQRRSDVNHATPFKLHSILFDAASGRIIKKLEWGTLSPDIGIAGRSDGNILIVSYDRLLVVSRDDDTIADIAMPAPPIEDSTLQRYRISPSGKTVVMQYGVHGEKECITVHTDTGELKREKCEFTPDSAISDNQVVVTRYETKGGRTPEVWIRNFDQDFHLLCHAVTGCGSSSFVNNDMLLMFHRGEIHLLRTTGETVVRQTIDTFAGFGLFFPHPIRSSGNGQRFGVLEAVIPITGPINLMDAIPGSLQIYDVAERQWVFALQNTNALMKRDLSFVLSPKGIMLATVIDGVVRVYTLPPAASANATH